MSEPMLNGLMMDDYPLSLTAVVERAEALTGGRKVVSRRPDGSIHRTTLGECARGRGAWPALADLGIGEGDRVGTLLWNQPEHLELYYAVPAMGAVVHTLNPRLHPDELGFIAGDAADRAIVVDESLLPAFDAFKSSHEFEHVIVVSLDPAPAAGRRDRLRVADRRRRADRMAGARTSAGRRRCVTRRAPPAGQGRALFPPRAGSALDRGGAAGRDEHLHAGHRAAGRADVPRQRVGDPLHRRA